MTNQEAIEILIKQVDGIPSDVWDEDCVKFANAVNFAIKALYTMDFVEDMSNEISRLKAEQKSKGKCKDCKNYYPYCEQFTNNPRGDGFCGNFKMTSDGYHYINCDDNWYCADFCPKEDMRGNENDH